ncbi:Aste57867_12827 [Aphanomyces stellatus]|uniref:Aste57867_12827 protein n=1 Tax=Aphanomyces stellatus TaxID=120398 RepID=A0A485KWK3_9STRA|nr:hypothetical protein As57867_012779 [Aphanomyces stellatus]VFT89674.1 Aste57867_12827 [Aphanomyces stellatus]
MVFVRFPRCGCGFDCVGCVSAIHFTVNVRCVFKCDLVSRYCQSFLGGAETWVSTFMSPSVVGRLYQQARSIQDEVAALDIQVVQFAQVDASSPVELLRMSVFDSCDPNFHLFAWFFLVDWANGLREVVSFQGDEGTLTVISAYTQYDVSTPNTLEIPHNAAYYCQLCMQYTTAMIFLVTFFALVYSAGLRGHIEGLNMVEINRVGGIVWVGRPLLFLRSLVAILFLSTTDVQLSISGIFTRMGVPQATGIQRLTTVLAGSETCWLVIVLTDLGLVVTKDHTNSYSLKASILTMVVSIVLSVTTPVVPSFSLARTCDAVQVDYQLACHAGVVTIGSDRRVLELVAIAASSVGLCFAFERWRNPTLTLPRHKLSLLLPASAHYLYNKGPWILDHTLYLDKASAFLCGLITVSYKQSVYVLDIKTWRTHRLRDESTRLISNIQYDQNRMAAAVPLHE